MDSTLLLLDAGADINASDHRGLTPLMRAAMNDFIGLVDLLMIKGGAALDIDQVGRAKGGPYNSICASYSPKLILRSTLVKGEPL